jgi:antitoxin CcdA
MKTVALSPSRKRAVNLTLNDELVRQARSMTDNLSAVVEALLSDFVTQKRQAGQTRIQEARRTSQAWNKFNAAEGSFADEYSTL